MLCVAPEQRRQRKNAIFHFPHYAARAMNGDRRPLPPPALLARIERQCAAPAPAACASITQALQETYGASLQGILFYGSCVRGMSLTQGVADAFLVVDSYRNAYSKPWQVWLNVWLPPNVFYREIPSEAGPLRLKLALISLADFTKGIRHGFHSYLWGRFAQPARILYARDGAVRAEFHGLLAQSVLTLLSSTIPSLPARINNAETIWTHALALSYSTEFRAEPDSKAAELARHHLADYGALLEDALPGLETVLRRADDGSYRRLADTHAARNTQKQWRRRRWSGQLLWLLRLLKAAFTFSNGVDYAAWKIGRHAGVEIEVTPRLRRYPLLFGWGVFLKLVRRGVLR